MWFVDELGVLGVLIYSLKSLMKHDKARTDVTWYYKAGESLTLTLEKVLVREMMKPKYIQWMTFRWLKIFRVE